MRGDCGQPVVVELQYLQVCDVMENVIREGGKKIVVNVKPPQFGQTLNGK